MVELEELTSFLMIILILKIMETCFVMESVSFELVFSYLIQLCCIAVSMLNLSRVLIVERLIEEESISVLTICCPYSLMTSLAKNVCVNFL